MHKQLFNSFCEIGCDPELFVSDGQKVIGAELVLPSAGLWNQNPTFTSFRVVNDGVQLELHPIQSSCRANVGTSIQNCFLAITEHLRVLQPGLRLDFSKVIRMTKKDLDCLSEKARLLGCDPSYNIYTGGTIPLKVSPATYRLRSAAGHIHLGGNQEFRERAVRLVKFCDVLVGNTCVLIDRDPRNITRRKVYGRAGEYRIPPHGVEYRTLSNFWLKSYQLMSFVFALARSSISLLNTAMIYNEESPIYKAWPKSFGGEPAGAPWNPEEDLLGKVDMERIERAINTNNFRLAKRNYEEYVKPFVASVAFHEGLTPGNLEAFDFFVEKGLDFWFPFDPVKHWCSKPEGHYSGWENFCEHIVKPVMQGATLPDNWWTSYHLGAVFNKKYYYGG
jgi:hypothetical protein